MLQQTRAETVIPYYNKFMRRFPSAKSLANASEKEVMAYWAGLGYYRRATHLRNAAQIIANKFPSTPGELRALPGIGRYTAGAVASIAFNRRVACADANVARVFARVFRLPDSGEKLKAQAERLSAEQMGCAAPGKWNQAVMELGATICLPRPRCEICPVKTDCIAHLTNSAAMYPAMPARKPTAALRRVCICACANGRLALQQIPVGQWCDKLWQFPCFEIQEDESAQDVLKKFRFKNARYIGSHRHMITNHRIEIAVYLTQQRIGNVQWLTPRQVSRLPMPSSQKAVLRMVYEALA